MKRSLKVFPVFFAAIFFSGICKAQDDMPDSRKKTESFQRFRIPDMRADIATFALAGISESVGALPLQKISYTALSNDSIMFEGAGIKAKVKLVPFIPAKHKLSYDEKYLVRIDKRPYYGNYSKVPSTEISEVSVIINNDTVVIPPLAYSDLYNMQFTYRDKGVQRTTDAVFKSKDGTKIYLYLFCKDNTGSYEVTWIIKDKKYFRRVLDYGFM